MPLITNNSSLGNLFGGKIATINFNYQPNSSPSSATLTIVSENNSFIEPELYSRIVLPILRIPMRIVECQFNDDGNSTTLQIELLDELSFTLDKNLILINGVHSTGLVKNETTKEKYPYIEYIGHPKANWKDFGPTTKRAVKVKNGILLGSNRTTIEVDQPYTNSNGSRFVFIPTENVPSVTLVYDAQERNEAAGTAKKEVYEAFEYHLGNGNDIDLFSHSNEWGYTLKDFGSAMASLGIKITGLPTSNDTAYFFNNAGSIRSVLSSILATLGLSFYVDPISQRIFVIDNQKITVINNNVKKLYNNRYSANNSGVTEGTFKKTLKDSTARKLVATTSFEKIDNKSENVDNPDRPKRKTFYRIDFTEYEGGWDRYELDFLKLFAGMYLTNIDRSLIDLWIFYLAKINDPANWSNKSDEDIIYGGSFTDGSTMIDKTEIEPFNKNPDENQSEIPYWQTALRSQTQNSNDFTKILPGFNESDLRGGYPNTKTISTEDGVIISNIYSADSPDRLEEWTKSMLWLGFGDFHITSPMSSLKTERYNFKDQTPYKVIGPFGADVLLSDIPELGSINQIAIRAGKEGQTVGDLYKMIKKEENQNENILGFKKSTGDTTIRSRNAYHFIAYLDIDLYQNIFNTDVGKELKENLYLFNIENTESTSNPEQYLLVTNTMTFIEENIKKTCEDLWSYWYIGQGDFEPKVSDTYVKDISLSRTFLYDRVSRAGEGGGGDEKSIEIESITKGIFTRESSLQDQSFLNIEVDSFNIGNLTKTEFSKETSIEHAGPFYEVNLNYYRPPNPSDIDIDQGLSSISSSIGSNGITTNIGYSSRKYQIIDRSFISKYSNKAVNSNNIVDNSPAFIKNQ